MTAAAFSFQPTPALLGLYAFCAPLGNLARFGSEEGGYGITTIILFAVILMNVGPVSYAMKRNRILFLLGLLTAWMGMASIFASNLAIAAGDLLQFALYVLFAAAAYRVNWTAEKVQRILLCFILGALLSSLITMIDFFGIVDVPRVNEGAGVYSDAGIGALLQASGPFFRRSAMAAYFALVIPVGVQGFLRAKTMSFRTRVLFLSSAVAAGLALFLTHNRAGLLGAIIAIGVINVSMAKSALRLIRLIVLTLLVSATIAFLLVTYFPKQVAVYEALLHLSDKVADGSVNYAESDAIRYVFFKYVMSSLKENPVGHGFTHITGIPGHPDSDPHNMITQIIWAAGVFGIGWIIYFAASVINRIKRRFSTEALADPFSRLSLIIGSGLLGWLFCGMMHQILGNGMAWLFLGVLMKMSNAEPMTTAENCVTVQAWERPPLAAT